MSSLKQTVSNKMKYWDKIILGDRSLQFWSLPLLLVMITHH